MDFGASEKDFSVAWDFFDTNLLLYYAFERLMDGIERPEYI